MSSTQSWLLVASQYKLEILVLALIAFIALFYAYVVIRRALRRTRDWICEKVYPGVVFVKQETFTIRDHLRSGIITVRDFINSYKSKK